MKICPLMSRKNSMMECVEGNCAIWHDSQNCAMLYSAIASDDIAAGVERIEEVVIKER